MARESSQINSFHSDKWKLHLSNLPSYSSQIADARLMSNSYKALTIPDVSVNLHDIPFNDRMVAFPMQRRNKFVSITITYRADEALRNYVACLMWAMGHMYNVAMKGSDTQYESVIRSVLFIMCDNQARPIARMRFKDCQFENLSALQPAFGEMKELDFTLKLKVQGFSYEYKVEGQNQWVGLKLDKDGGMQPITSIGI
jgi:hypothetical protein